MIVLPGDVQFPEEVVEGRPDTSEVAEYMVAGIKEQRVEEGDGDAAEHGGGAGGAGGAGGGCEQGGYSELKNSLSLARSPPVSSAHLAGKILGDS